MCVLNSFFTQPCTSYCSFTHRIRVEKKNKSLTLQLFQPFPALCVTWASLLVTISRVGLWVGEWKRRMTGVVFDDDGDCKIKRSILSAEQSSPIRTDQIILN